MKPKNSRKGENTKNELSRPVSFMMKHKQTNYDYLELGVKAVR